MDGRSASYKVTSSRAHAFTEQDVTTLKLTGAVLSAALIDTLATEALQAINVRLKAQKAELESANARLETLATTDGLTGTQKPSRTSRATAAKSSTALCVTTRLFP